MILVHVQKMYMKNQNTPRPSEHPPVMEGKHIEGQQKQVLE